MSRGSRGLTFVHDWEFPHGEMTALSAVAAPQRRLLFESWVVEMPVGLTPVRVLGPGWGREGFPRGFCGADEKAMRAIKSHLLHFVKTAILFLAPGRRPTSGYIQPSPGAKDLGGATWIMVIT